MTREAALVVMICVAAALLGVLAWAWVRRTRRDAALVPPVGDLPTGAVVTQTFETLYVATTRADQPLERLALRGLGFRSRATVTVADRAVALDLPGQPRIVLAADAIVAADQSTVAIDRVVERDGLTRVTWRIAPEQLVDTYLRPIEASARALADAIRPLTTTGTPA